MPAVLAAALLWAGWRVWATWWTTDDAFLSFRCAKNLVDGLGLVFNPGERVEVYSNPLWTLWSAAGLALGLGAEAWANAWGAECYLGAILLLGLNFHVLTRGGATALGLFPLAAVAAALHQEWNIYATGGLETSCFTFLLLAGYVIVARSRWRPLPIALAGLVLALASLTRHDGVLPAFVIGVYVLVFSPKRWIEATLFAACFAAVWLPFTLWRVSYYGDLFPNTYYAKSAYAMWYGQGWLYLRLYLEKYWAVALGPALLLLAPRRGRGRRDLANPASEPGQALLSGAIAASYVFYVVRVGGDFMFARFLIPATPFLLILLEVGWLRAFRSRPARGHAFAGLVLAGMVLSPTPVSGSEFRYGVANEWTYYSPARVARLDHRAAVLARYFEGLPVRVAFYGDEARVVYKARFAVAIESHAGLTDPAVARERLLRRGRPGHEKYPTAAYLIDERKADITFSGVPGKLIRLDQYIPRVYVAFEGDVLGQVLHWNVDLMEELRRRGARVDDRTWRDGFIEQVHRIPERERVGYFERLQRFYFDHVEDPARERLLRAALPEGAAPARSSADAETVTRLGANLAVLERRGSLPGAGAGSDPR